jgi:hypothetical protein
MYERDEKYLRRMLSAEPSSKAQVREMGDDVILTLATPPMAIPAPVRASIAKWEETHASSYRSLLQGLLIDQNLTMLLVDLSSARISMLLGVVPKRASGRSTEWHGVALRDYLEIDLSESSPSPTGRGSRNADVRVEGGLPRKADVVIRQHAIGSVPYLVIELAWNTQPEPVQSEISTVRVTRTALSHRMQLAPPNYPHVNAC